MANGMGLAFSQNTAQSNIDLAPIQTSINKPIIITQGIGCPYSLVGDCIWFCFRGIIARHKQACTCFLSCFQCFNVAMLSNQNADRLPYVGNRDFNNWFSRSLKTYRFPAAFVKKKSLKQNNTFPRTILQCYPYYTFFHSLPQSSFCI